MISVDPLAGYRMPAATKDDVIEAEEHGQSLNEAEIARRLAGGVEHRRPVRRPGEDGPFYRPSAGRACRAALGLDRPRRASRSRSQAK